MGRFILVSALLHFSIFLTSAKIKPTSSQISDKKNTSQIVVSTFYKPVRDFKFPKPLALKVDTPSLPSFAITENTSPKIQKDILPLKIHQLPTPKITESILTPRFSAEKFSTTSVEKPEATLKKGSITKVEQYKQTKVTAPSSLTHSDKNTNQSLVTVKKDDKLYEIVQPNSSTSSEKDDAQLFKKYIQLYRDEVYALVYRKFEKYAKNKKLTNNEEVVVLSVLINQDGKILEVKFSKVSVLEELNQLCLKVIEEIGSFPSFPPILKVDVIRLTIPFRFTIPKKSNNRRG
jgi:hypothetical protein